MKRPLKPDEVRIWSRVAATVHPLPGRATPTAPQAARPNEPTSATAPSPPPSERSARKAPPPPSAQPARVIGSPSPAPAEKDIEPNRRHRITRERDPIGARLDLHGMTYDRARAALERFVVRAHDEGLREVLVITGKGAQGDGLLRRSAPEWLAASHLAHIVAGVSEAHRRHGGAGALYVALKRKGR